jgi:hypothetical protein
MDAILTQPDEIKRQLKRLDEDSARAIRAVLTAQAAGTPPAQADLDRLAALEAKAAELRARLAGA